MKIEQPSKMLLWIRLKIIHIYAIHFSFFVWSNFHFPTLGSSNPVNDVQDPESFEFQILK